MNRTLLAVALMLLVVPAPAGSQTAEPSRPYAWDVSRAVLIDPTTYAPAIISYKAMMNDWDTSQVLFAHGWYEANPRFTASGRPNDVAVAYDEGKRRIQSASWKVLAFSVANNALAGVGERWLVSRYPHRKKLIKTFSWIERIGFASVLTYRNSASHLRQAGENRRLSRELGYSR